MIKFVAKTKDSQLVGLGLSAHNVRLLQEGKPISVRVQDLGIDSDIEVMIFYGATEAQMVEDLKDYIGATTVVHPGDERLNPEHYTKEEK